MNLSSALFSLFGSSLNSSPVSSCTCSSVIAFSRSVNSKGFNVLKNKFKLTSLNASISSNASSRISWQGFITILLNSTKLLSNSSLLELKPLLFATPNNKGLVTECPSIILRIASSLKVLYKSGASFTGIESTVVLESELLLKATITFSPVVPVSCERTLFLIIICCSSLGTPLLKLTTARPEKPQFTSFIK